MGNSGSTLGWQEAVAPEDGAANDRPPPLAAHIVASRLGYMHHGIYVGDGKVMHYAGMSRAFRRRPVAEVSLTEFSRGRPVRVVRHPQQRFTTNEVIARARSRLGEDCYRLLSNNCEHFCEWCIGGESRSRQIELWVERARPVLQPLCRLVDLRMTIGGAITVAGD